MHKLDEFSQSEARPIRHVKLDGQDAHRRESSLSGLFSRCGIELAKPQAVSTPGKSIRFLSEKPNLVDANSLDASSPVRIAADKKFAQQKKQVLKDGASRGVPSKWLSQILEHSKLYTDKDSTLSNDKHLCLVWGLEFEEREVYQPISTEKTQTTVPSPPPVVSPPILAFDPDPVIVDPVEVDDEDGPIPPGGGGPAPIDEHPKRWWIWLLIALLLILIAILLLSIDGCNRHAPLMANYSPVTGRVELNPLPGFTPDQPNNMTPIPVEQIIQDPNTGQEIAEGRVNTYPKNQDISFTQYLTTLQAALSDSTIVVTDYCSETRRVQLDIGNMDYSSFVSGLKAQMSDYDLLIWPERIVTLSRSSSNITSNASAGWHLDAIHAYDGWAIQKGDPAIILAVIDSGFDLQHPDLNQDTVASYHVPSRTFEVYANGEITHGTHVAGLAVGELENQTGTIGVGQGCSWMPVQLSDQNENIGLPMTHIVDGVLYAMNHGADVINMSLGNEINRAFLSNLENYIASTEDEGGFWNELYRIGERNNTLFVLAAGNDALPLELDPMHRSPLPIYVAATDHDGHLARDFSNFPTGGILPGIAQICVAAPGVDIMSCEVDGDLVSMPGTSMSCPQVVGAAGLIKSAMPHISNQEVRDLFGALPEYVTSCEMDAWALLPSPSIKMAGSKWILDANKAHPEQVELHFLPSGKLKCQNCDNDYQRGEWFLTGPHLELHLKDHLGKITSSLKGSWTDGTFNGNLVMHIGNGQGTFQLKPNDLANVIPKSSRIPFLNVRALLNQLESTQPIL